jgi:hypothetical protein
MLQHGRCQESLAPAPFCCIDDSEVFREYAQDAYYRNCMKREFFFYRFFLNTSTHFAHKKKMHERMKLYLPDLYSVFKPQPRRSNRARRHA